MLNLRGEKNQKSTYPPGKCISYLFFARIGLALDLVLPGVQLGLVLEQNEVL